MGLGTRVNGEPPRDKCCPEKQDCPPVPDPCAEMPISDLWGSDEVIDYIRGLRVFASVDECGLETRRCKTVIFSEDTIRNALAGEGGDAVWGGITGDITDQQDLTALIQQALTQANNQANQGDAATLQAANDYADSLVGGGMVWRGEWQPGSYSENDVVRDGDWTMVALTDTTDRPAPQPIMPATYLYDGADPMASPSGLQVIVGTQYSNAVNDYFVSGYRVHMVAGNRYQIALVRDPSGSADFETLGVYDATETGWMEFPLAPRLVQAGTTFQLLALVKVVAATGGSLGLTYDYIPYNDDPPAAGEIRQSNYPNDILRVSKADQTANPGADAFLSGMGIGDTITVDSTGISWTVQTATDMGAYMEYTVSPEQQISGGGGNQTYVMTFESASAGGIPIIEDVDYWLGSPFDVQGVYGLDVPLSGVALNDTAYGVDIRVQEAQISPDWDVVAHSAGGVSSGGGDGAAYDPRIKTLGIYTISPVEWDYAAYPDGFRADIVGDTTFDVLNLPTLVDGNVIECCLHVYDDTGGRALTWPSDWVNAPATSIAGSQVFNIRIEFDHVYCGYPVERLD